jgi:hypothetical protein
MGEIRELLERQGRWQCARKSLSWADKIRMIESVRESVIAWRSGADTRPSRGDNSAAGQNHTHRQG